MTVGTDYAQTTVTGAALTGAGVQSGQYDSGDQVVLAAAFVDTATGVSVDPDGVTVTWGSSEVGPFALSYDGTSDLVKTGTGTYRVVIDTSGQVGRLVQWQWQWVGTGENGGSASGSFLVTGVPFAGSEPTPPLPTDYDGGTATTTVFDLVLDGGDSTSFLEA